MQLPTTIEAIYQNYLARREALIKALTEDAAELYAQCDPARENLVLIGHSDGTWSVNPPVEEVPPEIPEPVLGINFARDGMERKDWLALCAVHGDAWLMALVFFYAARFADDGRAELFSLINQHPTVYEVVTGRVSRNKLFKKKPAVVSQRAGPGSAAAALQQQHLQQQQPSGYGPAQPMQQQPLQPFVHPGSKQVQAADAPLPTGRLLTFADVSPALKGRQAELFWPDDGKWYLVEIHSLDVRTRQARVMYDTGEVEELDMNEVIRDGHMSLLA